MHAALGAEHYAARLGEEEVAVVHPEDCHWVFGRYVYQTVALRIAPCERMPTVSSWLLSRHRILSLSLLHTLRIRPSTLPVLRPSSRRRRARRYCQLLRLQTLPRPTRLRPRHRVAVAFMAGPVSARGWSDGCSCAGGICMAPAQRRDSVVSHA
mgnify:CR=1 FL=1